VSMLLQSPPIERVLREHGALLKQKRTIARQNFCEYYLM
jgi:hypothetical protein